MKEEMMSFGRKTCSEDLFSRTRPRLRALGTGSIEPLRIARSLGVVLIEKDYNRSYSTHALKSMPCEVIALILNIYSVSPQIPSVSFLLNRKLLSDKKW